jgi:parvulin-like peptidyl-prolyl isomerase
MKPGDLTPVLRTGRGFQVIKVEALEGAAVKPFEESRNDIADRIANEKRRGEFLKFMEKLRAQAIIDWKNDEVKKAWELGLKQTAAPPSQGQP